MALRNLEVQRMVTERHIPDDQLLQLWFEKALTEYSNDAEILIRIVDEEEISALNLQYRHRQGATNILSFPFAAPEFITGVHLLGDLVICAPVLEQEAKEQQKSLEDHWAHIIIHGIFHLIGYDHIDEQDALEMETQEILILQQLNIDNPYQER